MSHLPASSFSAHSISHWILSILPSQCHSIRTPCITLHWTNCMFIVLLTNDFQATSFPESNISCVHAARIVFLKEFIFPSLFKNIQVDSIWSKSKSLRKPSPPPSFSCSLTSVSSLLIHPRSTVLQLQN